MASSISKPVGVAASLQSKSCRPSSDVQRLLRPRLTGGDARFFCRNHFSRQPAVCSVIDVRGRVATCELA